MSGGSFDYNCFRITEFANELKHRIEVNDNKELDNYGDKIGMHYSKDTLEKLLICWEVINLAGNLAHEVEWLYSGDHGEESFIKLVDIALGKVIT